MYPLLSLRGCYIRNVVHGSDEDYDDDDARTVGWLIALKMTATTAMTKG